MWAKTGAVRCIAKQWVRRAVFSLCATEFFYPALQPWVHYIPLATDMSDAAEKFEWAIDPANEKMARGIARAGYELVRDQLRNEDGAFGVCVARCLGSADVFSHTVKEYWRELLLAYSSLTEWKVEPRPSFELKSPDKAQRRSSIQEMVFPGIPKKYQRYTDV